MIQQQEKVKEDSEANESPLNTEEILSILNKTKELNFLKENKIFENFSSEFKSFNLEEIAKKNNGDSITTQKIEKNIDEKVQKELNTSSQVKEENNLESEKIIIDEEELKRQEKIYTQEQHEKLVNDAKEKSFKEGIQKGFEQGEKNIKDELQKGEEAQALALKNTIDNLFYVAPEFLEKLNLTINESIRDICNQILGYKISEIPKQFLEKINNLVSSIESSSNRIVVFLNVEDQKVLNEFLKNNKTLADVTFKIDETLQRGDLIIKSGGIEINDISSKKVDLISDSNIDKNLKELANENSAKIENAKINNDDQDLEVKIEAKNDKIQQKNEDIQSKLKTEFIENSNILSDPKYSEKTNKDGNFKEKISDKIDEMGEKTQKQKSDKEKSMNEIEASQKNDDKLTNK